MQVENFLAASAFLKLVLSGILILDTARDNFHFEIGTQRIAKIKEPNDEKLNMRNYLSANSVQPGIRPTSCQKPIEGPSQDGAAGLQTGIRK